MMICGRSVFLGIFVAFMGVWATTAGAAPYDNPNGNTHVVCVNDYRQSYELYIPPSAPATNRPILYVFDPGGDGKSALIWLAPAAAANGWVLAASNNSKNGPWSVIFDAQDAIIRDTEARWNLHPTRRFAAGFSGGARASLALAFRYPSKICGTLCMGAGWPINTTLTASNSNLVVRLLIGTEDSNLSYDIPETQVLLMDAGVRCEVSTYSGGHVWPPAPLVLSAARWLNENAQIDPNAGVTPQTCSGQSWFGQAPPPFDGYWDAYYSDTYTGYSMFEDFQGVQGPISRVQWCGITATYDYTFDRWLPRESDSDTFIVSLHPNVGGVPGPAVHEETVTAERVDGPGVYGIEGAPRLYTPRHYTAYLSSPVTLSSGFVRIQQVASSDTIFMWLTSTEGNGYAVHYSDGYYDFSYDDLTLCLSAEELTCSFTTSSTLGEPPYAVQFHGTVSGTMDEAVTWFWDFGDGTTATGDANPTHVYTSDGNFTVSVTVTTPSRSVTETRGSLVHVALALPASSWEAVSIQLVALLCLGGMTAVALKRRPKGQASGFNARR